MRAYTSRTAAMAAAVVVSIAAAAGPAGAQLDRTAVGSRFTLDIPAANGTVTLKTIEGGYLFNQVVPDGGAGKRVAGTRIAPFVLTTYPNMAMALLKAAMEGTPLDGRLIVGDFNYKAQNVTEFRQAIATRLAFTPLDGASKDQCSVEVTLAPTAIASLPGEGGDMSTKLAVKQKTCMRSNFRVELGNLPTKRIVGMDSIVLRRPGAEVAAGSARAMTKSGGSAGAWEADNVKLSVSMADLEAYLRWNDEFVVKGMNGVEKELTLDVVYLSADLKEEMFRLHGSGVGLVALRRSLTANSETSARFEIELYVERWEIVPGTTTVGSVP